MSHLGHSLIERYQQLCRRVAKEFRRSRRLHPGRIHCRKRCTGCCHHLFQISELEAARISKHVKTLPPLQRHRLLDKARAYRPARQAIMNEHGYIDARGSLPPPGTRLPCPALADGLCAIYEHRPLICRKFGMPLHHPDRPGRIFACELNFRAGELIEDTQLVTIQSAMHQSWVETQQDYNRAGGRRYPYPISVADALIEDFEEYLP